MPNNSKDYYETLGVSKTASQDEIKSAYRKLAKLYHPDLHPNDAQCAQKFKEINEAYEVLGDANKRSNYDQFGSASGNPNDFFGGNGAGGFSGHFGSGGFSGFEDIFDIFSSFGGSSRRGESSMPQIQGEDIVVNINLSFKEAVFGCEKIIKTTKLQKCKSCGGSGAKGGTEYQTCSDCHGTGKVRYTQNTLFGQMVSEGPCKTCNATGKIIKTKCPDCSGKGNTKVQEEIKIKIPAGIDNNQVITMRGKGNASTRQGPNGDLVINVSVDKHPVLEREGFNLLLDLPIPFTTAYLGGKVKIPLADGFYDLTIPALTQPNTVFKLKNKGVKYLQKDIYGDLIVTVRVEMPSQLGKYEKELVEKLDENISLGAYKKFKTYQDKLSKL